MRLLYALVLLALGLLVADATRAHEWYPLECCSERDCAPIPPPKEASGGWVLPDGRRVLYKDAKPSPDGRFHLCESQWQTEKKDRTVLCFFAPIGGV